MTALYVALGGAFGSLLRYVLSLCLTQPWATLAVNILGCGIMGAVAGHFSSHPVLRPLVMVGMLGGFTTFSSFALDTALMAERHPPAWAMAYAAASVIGSLVAFAIPYYLLRTQ